MTPALAESRGVPPSTPEGEPTALVGAGASRPTFGGDTASPGAGRPLHAPEPADPARMAPGDEEAGGHGFVMSGSVRLHYEWVRAPRDGETPIVLVHGLACGARMWARQRRVLSAAAPLLLYDQRGHGLSDAPHEPAAYGAGPLARDLVALLDALAVPRAHVLGFSMGGAAALALAARRPERVASLVLADVGAGADDGWKLGWLAGRWAALARAGEVEDAVPTPPRAPPALVDEMLRGEFFKTYALHSPRARAHMAALLARHPAHGLRHTFEQVLMRRRSLYRARALLRSIRAPTLVLVGALDNPCRNAAKLLSATIPGAEFVRLAGAGHMAPLEAPAAFNEAVLDFVARHG